MPTPHPHPFFVPVLVLVSTALPANAQDDPGKALDWLLGTWRAGFKPHGEKQRAPTLTFDWSEGNDYLRMVGHQPETDGSLVVEHQTFLMWNPATHRFEFQGVYPDARHAMLQNGHVELLRDGGVRLHVNVHYEAGRTLPFSRGTVAGPGGTTQQYQRTFRRDGADAIRATFQLKRGDRWEDPHPKSKPESYPWIRVKDTNDAAIPAWATAHMAGLVQGSGRWITSNAKYRSADEPADAYGLEWSRTLGGKGVRGRLFSLRDGKDVATHWELHTYWHPKERRLVAAQFGGDGTVGTGAIRESGDGGLMIEQTMCAASGGQSRVRHRSTFTDKTRVDDVFHWDEGKWKPGRSYTWHLAEPTATKKR